MPVYTCVNTDRDVILEHPASVLYQGESVSLRCRHRAQRKQNNASFYKDGSLIETDANRQPPIISENTAKMTIRLLSGQGSYTCKFDEGEESEAIKPKVDRK